jgi:hypothetical protein
VANPTKPKAIADILLRNREKLIDFLTSFHTDRKFSFLVPSPIFTNQNSSQVPTMNSSMMKKLI